MTALVTIEQWPRPVRVQAGRTLLESAMDAGIPYPHGCRSGNCGACKSRLLSGAVEMAPYSDHALSSAERKDGFILACRARPLGDCMVAWRDLDLSAGNRNTQP